DILIEEKSAGETVGLSALIPPYRFTLSAVAAQASEIIALPRVELQGHFATWPAIGYKIGANLAVVIGQRLQTVQAMWLREMQRTIELSSA
ncbi:MAG: hypothetical protein ACRD3Q_14855, partial [Terriglobales bacterium]